MGKEKLVQEIERLRSQLPKLRRARLKETQTRTIVIQPLLEALGWDVRDLSQVEEEHPTVDGKSVDYALKLEGRPVLLVEAKPLGDDLRDIRAITQVVSYAANEGIQWCVLTNGVKWQVYRSMEKCPAPQKLLFEVSLEPKDTPDSEISEAAERLWWLSADEMAKGTLDEEGRRVFTDGKVRKALESILREPPPALVRLVRKSLADDTLKPKDIRESLARVWFDLTGETPPIPPRERPEPAKPRKRSGGEKWTVEHLLEGKPEKVVDLYHQVDEFITSLEPRRMERRPRKWYISYYVGPKTAFAWLEIGASYLKVFVWLPYAALQSPPSFARDVSKIGHCGGGNLELTLKSPSDLRKAEPIIREAFGRALEKAKERR